MGLGSIPASTFLVRVPWATPPNISRNSTDVMKVGLSGCGAEYGIVAPNVANGIRCKRAQNRRRFGFGGFAELATIALWIG